MLDAEIRRREAAEEVLHENEACRRLLMGVTQSIVFRVDAASGFFTFLSPLFETLTGWTVDEWIGKPFIGLVHPDDVSRALCIFETLRAGKTPPSYELRIPHRDGQCGTGNFQSVPEIRQGRVTGVLGIVRDVTKRRQMETLLKNQAQILDGIPDPAWMKTRDGVFLAVNRAWSLFTGKEPEQAVGNKDSDIFDQTIASRMRQQDRAVILSKQPIRIEEILPGTEGQNYFDTVLTPLFDGNKEVTGIIGIARDVTERKTMEEQFLRNQRMESIGSLASGIAHDLNNILGPIMMSASMLREERSLQTFDELVTIIQEAAQRGADIVSQVLAFARGTKGERKPMQPRFLIRQVERILKEILPKSIAFTASLSDGLWNITGDLTQLHQVFVNLCVNARDAMPDGGTLRLSAKNCELSATVASRIPNARPGCYVRMTVADSGTGIPPDIVGKIFEPFFTTKEPGKGTGLGLSTVLGIVHSHNGFIALDTKTGRGSKFDIYLPATMEPLAADAANKAMAEQPAPLPVGNGETILVVDDEVSICKMAGTILDKKGYRVLTASGGKEALELIRRHGGTIRAVLTDLAMPGMDGWSLIRTLKKTASGAALIASTGQSVSKDQRPHGAHYFLGKPYTATQLLQTVHQAIHGKRRS